eukprot:1145346-Pelagomonas_calceolata.AAC.8
MRMYHTHFGIPLCFYYYFLGWTALVTGTFLLQLSCPRGQALKPGHGMLRHCYGCVQIQTAEGLEGSRRPKSPR